MKEYPKACEVFSVAIRSKLSILMGTQRYSIQDVYEKTGLARSTIANLYHDKTQRIDYETIDKLCKLFECNVGDVIAFYDVENK
ncbi:helix-turn-helix domain-containing protein [Paenibacillus sp. CMAA1364]